MMISVGLKRIFAVRIYALKYCSSASLFVLSNVYSRRIGSISKGNSFKSMIDQTSLKHSHELNVEGPFYLVWPMLPEQFK